MRNGSHAAPPTSPARFEAAPSYDAFHQLRRLVVALAGTTDAPKLFFVTRNVQALGVPLSVGSGMLKDLRERFVDPPGYLPGRPDLDQVHSVYRDGQRSVIREIHQQLNIDRKRKR